jgi:hypothetical protein
MYVSADFQISIEIGLPRLSELKTYTSLMQLAKPFVELEFYTMADPHVSCVWSVL